MQYECEGECILSRKQCKGECSKQVPKLCGDGCIPASETCYVWDKKVNGSVKAE